MTTMLERTRMILRGEAPPPPIAALLGFTLTSVGDGEATIELKVDERLANPMGTLHGGVLGDIADAAMGMAWASTLGEGETFTTLELKINFLKPVWSGTLRARGRVVKAGRTVGLVECDVLDAEDRLVARASSTCMTLRGAQAEGR
jgi:uncharacterized protein (TIGR00369 family)